MNLLGKAGRGKLIGSLIVLGASLFLQPEGLHASEGPASLRQVVVASTFVALVTLRSANLDRSGLMKFSAKVVEMWKGEHRGILQWTAAWPSYCLSTDFVGADAVVFLSPPSKTELKLPGDGKVGGVATDQNSLAPTMNYSHLPVIGDSRQGQVLMHCVHPPDGVKPSLELTRVGLGRAELVPVPILRTLVQDAVRGESRMPKSEKGQRL
jgi:hypothetical protein